MTLFKVVIRLHSQYSTSTIVIDLVICITYVSFLCSPLKSSHSATFTHYTLYFSHSVLETIQYLPMIWTPCGATLRCTLHSHEFSRLPSTYPWSELPVVTHYIVLYTPMSSRDHLELTHDLNSLWCHTTLYSTLPWVPRTIQVLTSSAVHSSGDVRSADKVPDHQW